MAAIRYVSPLRYPGGKTRMRAALGKLMADQYGLLDVCLWVEPFAGGGGAGLALLADDHTAVEEVWLIEKNPALAAFWRVACRDDWLASTVTTLTPSMGLWQASKAAVAASEAGDDVPDDDLAIAALVVNRCSRSGMVTTSSGPIGGKHQTGRWHLASRWQPTELARRLRRVHEWASVGRLRFWEGDALDHIADLGASGVEEEVLMFVDPPYIRDGARLYQHGRMDHDALSRLLTSSPARWMLTYDKHPLIPALYPTQRIIEYQIAHHANVRDIDWEYAVLSDNLLIDAQPSFLPDGISRWLCTAESVSVDEQCPLF